MTTEQFTAEFEKTRPQLKSYILRITASVNDTEDIVQDTYIRAVEKIDSFRGDASVKTWLFTIASNLAKDNLRVKRRWVENVTDITKVAALSNPAFFKEAMTIRATSPQGHLKLRNILHFA